MGYNNDFNQILSEYKKNIEHLENAVKNVDENNLIAKLDNSNIKIKQLEEQIHSYKEKIFKNENTIQNMVMK